MRNFFIVFFTMLIVFAYASADNAVSPLVAVFQNFFQVPQATVLYLISSCTFGIVVGTFIGPTLIARYSVSKVLVYSSIVLSLVTIFFMTGHYFYLAIFWRFVFGVCCGFLNGIIWWITFHGVTGKTTDVMVIVTTAARPMAMCLGIPLVGIITSLVSWQSAYVFLVIALLFSAGFLFFSFKDSKKQDGSIKNPSLIQAYKDIFNLPYSFKFYFGLLLNSFCYFGFYAFAGIWFIQNYHLNFLQISTLFLLLGGAEVFASFIASLIYRVFLYRKAFFIVSVLTVVFFPLFIYGYFSLYISIGLIMLFILFNRAAIFAMIRTLPTMFPSQQNKTYLGSLITVSIWLGFSLVSGVQGKLLPYVGIYVMETILFFSLIFGTVLVYSAQKKAVFTVIDRIK